MKRKRNSIEAFSIQLSAVSLLICAVLLAGCGQEVLYKDLNQEDANRVMVLLQQSGVPATLDQEVRQNEIFWTIKVDKEVLHKARELIVAGNVISPRSPGLQEVYQGKGSSGWIRTPAEEKARYLLALKGEIINSLKKLPEVVDVDVVLNTPQQEELGNAEKKRPTASVVIKAQSPPSGQVSSLREMKVQEFVANSIEGMSPRDVAVMIHYAPPVATTLRPGETVTLPKTGESRRVNLETKPEDLPVKLMGLKLDRDSRERLKIYLIVFFAVLIVLSVALIVSILQASRFRHEIKSLKGPGSAPALEGQVLEDQSPRLRAPNRQEE